MIDKTANQNFGVGLGSFLVPGILRRVSPKNSIVPIVVDSPHSGTQYPEDFEFLVPKIMLQRAEDSYVGELFSDAPHNGATFIEALFPRSYIDPNRSINDLDPELLETDWSGSIKMGEKSRLGHGLIWRLCPPDRPMYKERLSESKVRHRIESYWRPYHQCLSKTIDTLHSRFGETWHINCHSMPSGSAPSVVAQNGRKQADFVLGDQDGTTCSMQLRQIISKTLINMGYTVAINDPYKGVELIKAYSNPDYARHSIQIEINRAIYMNERNLERNVNFWELKRNLKQLISVLADFVGFQSSAAAE